MAERAPGQQPKPSPKDIEVWEPEPNSNGQVGSIYKQAIPLVNAMRKPGEWQTYDIVWTAPTFKANGTIKTPARVTAFHNGVLIQNNHELRGETLYIGTPFHQAHGATPIKLSKERAYVQHDDER